MTHFPLAKRSLQPRQDPIELSMKIKINRDFGIMIRFCTFYSHFPKTVGFPNPESTARTIVKYIKTRPDSRLPKSRAGGQEPYLSSPGHLGRNSEVKEIKS